MKKILYGVLILFVIALIISYPAVFIGLALSFWGINKIAKAKQSGTKSKSGIVILVIGILLFIGGLGSGGTIDTASDVEKDAVVEEPAPAEEKEHEAVEEQEELEEEAVEKEGEKTEEEKTEVADQVDEKKDEGATTNTGPTTEQLAKELGLELVTVSRVIDGDTIELADGRKVRLIGVNTPESTTRTEPFGKEASNYTKSKLEGKQVYLQRDVSETDRYGRYLRLVWLDVPNDFDSESEIRAKMFNADLVINGYAEPSTYPPDVRYAEYFRKFAREAREKETGLWAYGEEGTTKGDFDSSSSTSSQSSQSGTTTGSGKTGGTSSGTDSASSGNKENFKNCTELRKVYPEGVPEGHPAYRPKHDRDKDGWACEISK